jgi:hypothetical protein
VLVVLGSQPQLDIAQRYAKVRKGEGLDRFANPIPFAFAYLCVPLRDAQIRPQFRYALARPGYAVFADAIFWSNDFSASTARKMAKPMPTGRNQSRAEIGAELNHKFSNGT